MARPSHAKENLIKAAYDLIWENSYGSTTVDDICERAEVRKGSFYHFFESKAHLTIATIDAAWTDRLPQLNAIFSALVPPLERFRRYCDAMLAYQEGRRSLTGHVCGCPLSSLGSEVGTKDELIRSKVVEIFAHHLQFYESAIRDAAREGLIDGSDATFKASTLQTFIQGACTHARVLNDLEPIRQLHRAILTILGAAPPALS
jgi:TetR/AcrR family transcriptional regulator, transcriptional repressor for nem operon